MIFRRAIQRYGQAPEPDTPYVRAGQVWDDRIGSARVQARNWRLMAFGTLMLTGAISSALIWQSLQSRVVPYIVEVDRLGEARAVTEAQAAFHPTDPQIAWHLARLIENIRSVSLDPVLMRRDWLSAYDFATERGARFLSAYARAADPFGRVGEATVSVEVTSVIRASDRSFQVKWTETAYEHGNKAGSSHWTGILTIATKPPVSPDTLRKNPLGIYVDAIDWSRELEPAAPPPASPMRAPTGEAPGSNSAPGAPLGPDLAVSSSLQPEIQP
jgi:type IV secretory pathway TrbF-like protein